MSVSFSLKGLLMCTAGAAAAIYGVLFPSPVFANVCFTLILAAILGSIVAAFAERDRTRLFWIGFAVFSGGYYSQALLPFTEVAQIRTQMLVNGDMMLDEVELIGPQLVTSPIIDWVYETLVCRDFSEKAHWLQVSGKDPEYLSFEISAHSWFALAFGWLGGFLGAWLGGRQSESTLAVTH